MGRGGWLAQFPDQLFRRGAGVDVSCRYPFREGVDGAAAAVEDSEHRSFKANRIFQICCQCIDVGELALC
jgi:hypothetical protein